MWVRLSGYLGWGAIRIALILGSVRVAELFLSEANHRWLDVADLVVAAAVNGIAYATLACLDAVLHLETRMRVEGLDIALGRTSGGADRLVLTGPAR